MFTVGVACVCQILCMPSCCRRLKSGPTDRAHQIRHHAPTAGDADNILLVAFYGLYFDVFAWLGDARRVFRLCRHFIPMFMWIDSREHGVGEYS